MRCLIAVVTLQVACTPAHVELPHEDGTPFLDHDAVAAFSTRAALVGDPGQARLTTDGPPLPDEAGFVLPDRELVVVDTADEVRISWSNRRVQLLLWLDRVQLLDVITATTVGTTRYADGEGHVRWPAGQPVELLDADTDQVMVGVDLDGLRLQTWVPAGDVDQVWDEDSYVSPGRAAADLWVSGEVLDAPRGATLAWPIEAPVSMEDDGDPVDGYQPVRWVDGGVELLGWVHEDDVEPQMVRRVTGMCGGCYGSGGWGFSSHTNVPAHTPLRSAPDGPVIGQTLVDMYVDFSSGTGWGATEAATPWGLATVAVEEPW